jgi:signal transduction histidine kinase
MLTGDAVTTQAPSSGASPPLRGPFTRWPRTTDLVLAGIAFAVPVLLSFEDPSQEFAFRFVSDAPIAFFLVFGFASVALYWRRSQPLVVLGVILVASAISIVLGYADGPWVAFLISLYSVGRYVADDQRSYYALSSAIALVGIHVLTGGEPPVSVGIGVFVTSLVWYIGRRIRIRGEYLTLLQERAAQLERKKAAEASRAVAEERTRIARELHDVVAHQVTLMTVQAGAAKTVSIDDPESAVKAMEAVENAGRQALGELRHLLGVLRPQSEMDGLGPQPGLADVPLLVQHLGEAGLEVSLEIEDLRPDLPTRVDLSAYRIVQEALTNVLKHAGPDTRTEVRLSSNNDRVSIEVVDDGHLDSVLPGSGHGIVGMRERALLLGGSLETGPRPGGGFRVVAHIPMGEEHL